jgi:hypothetical protein
MLVYATSMLMDCKQLSDVSLRSSNPFSDSISSPQKYVQQGAIRARLLL